MVEGDSRGEGGIYMCCGPDGDLLKLGRRGEGGAEREADTKVKAWWIFPAFFFFLPLLLFPSLRSWYLPICGRAVNGRMRRRRGEKTL